MQYKKNLLLFDLDDTLLTSNKTVSNATALAIKACKAENMLIGYITARSPRKVKELLRDLPCDCIAYYNGASIYIGDKLIESNVIPYNTAIKIMNDIKQAYQNSKIGAYLEPYNYFNGEIRNIETNETWISSIFELPRFDIQRIRIVFGKEDTIELTKYMTDETIHYITSDGTAIILNKNANKEHALIKCADWFDISLADVIAFGDDINDLDMVKMAGTGVAMGNAIEQIKKNADFITDTNDNDGIAMWINKYLYV